MTLVNKQNSDDTGLRYTKETSLGVLPAAASQIWYPAEPNSYSDFGGQIKTVARLPINASRQNQKGVTVDLDASGGFNQDFTKTNMLRFLQGFMFANVRDTYDSQPLNAAAVTDIAAANTGHEYTSAAFGHGSKVLANSLVYASGFALGANNGLKVVASLTAETTIVVTDTGITDEASSAAHRLQVVGYEFASATLEVDVSGDLPVLFRASGSFDFTTLGLVPGQFIFVGGDSSTNKFANAVNNGWARVHSVVASGITLDKTTTTMVTDTGSGKLIQIFFGYVLKNESNPALIKESSWTLERALGRSNTADSGQQGEYLAGSVANELTLNVKQADKLNADLTFVSIDHYTRDDTDDLLSNLAVVAGSAANAPAIVSEDAYNTSSHFSRLRMSVLDPTDANPSPLFAYLTEFTVVVNNNVTPNKAVSVLGAFDVSTGQFDVSGKVTAYFADVAAVDAVRNNADVTLDFCVVRDNAGFCFDIPLLALGDGRLSVQLNNPITLPLDMNAGADRTFNHTLLFGYFPYLPDAAA